MDLLNLAPDAGVRQVSHAFIANQKQPISRSVQQQQCFFETRIETGQKGDVREVFPVAINGEEIGALLLHPGNGGIDTGKILGNGNGWEILFGTPEFRQADWTE